jgi:hypothetical protein
MKQKLFILFFIIFGLFSCEPKCDDTGIVIQVTELKRGECKYYITVDINERFHKTIKMRTNTLFSVGDTVKLMKLQ